MTNVTTAPEQPERLDLRSADIASDKRDELLRLFPEARTEDGQIDFDQLQRALGESVDPGKERYGLTWPGKADCFKTIQSPSLGTLRPAKDESVNWDTTENLVIEGDNLEVLKLLQKSYLGKIKMIYIDPPYNTGNDFIYPDDYAESLKTYLQFTGQADDAGRRFSTNTDTDGRFHSKWLNMMYPRLYLARNLLRDDGVIFISIDDGEAENLRRLCDEIFGEENFVAQIEWQKKYSVSNNHKGIASVRDHILVYGRSGSFAVGLLPRDDDSIRRYQNPDDDPRGPWKPVDYWNIAPVEARPNLVYSIVNPTTGEKISPTKKAWKYAYDVHRRHVAEGRLWWGIHGTNSVPALKLFLSDVKDGLVPDNWWSHQDSGHTDEAKKSLDRLFDGVAPFDNPKPLRLVERMFRVSSVTADDIVLDFFAGSGTTGHAVLDLNRTDGGNRRFILVQLPEQTDREDYPTIADITKERARRAIAKLNVDDPDGAATQDRGFRVFKLAESNIVPWDGGMAHDEAILTKQLELHVDHVRDDRTADDVLYEILLKTGFPLSTKVETVDLEGIGVTSVAGGTLLICLAQALSLELVRAVASRKPERAVFLDEGFAGNDALKANAAQIFRAAGVTFRTV